MERSYLTTPHGEISYLERPGQFPLVFLHGLGGSGNNWLKLSQHLHEKYRLIMPDLPGHGRSFKNLRDFSVMEQVESLRLFIEGLGLKEYGLIGNSYGGWISMKYSTTVVSPAYLILIDSAGINPTVGENPGEGKETFLDRVMKMNPKNDRDVISRIVDNNASGREKLDSESLGKITSHTLIIWGEHDRLIPLSYGEKLNGYIHGSSMSVIPHGGHTPHSTHPLEVAGLISDFVRV